MRMGMEKRVGQRNSYTNWIPVCAGMTWMFSLLRFQLSSPRSLSSIPAYVEDRL